MKQQPIYPNGTRLEALVISDDRILVIKRFHKGNNYFVLPGGGWESPETFEEGVVREVMEETSIDVEIIRLVFDLIVEDDSRNVVYLCRYIKGEPILGNFNEKESMENNPSDTYEPMWLPINQLDTTKLYKLEFRDWFLENYINRVLPNNPEKQSVRPLSLRWNTSSRTSSRHTRN